MFGPERDGECKIAILLVGCQKEWSRWTKEVGEVWREVLQVFGKVVEKRRLWCHESDGIKRTIKICVRFETLPWMFLIICSNTAILTGLFQILWGFFWKSYW